MIVKILKEYCDLSDRPVPTIFEFVPSKDQPLMFRENNLLVLKQDHFDKISQSSDFWAYLHLSLDVLNGVGGFGSKHVRISDDTDIKMVKEFIVNQ